MAKSELVIYIKKQLQSGHSMNEIRKILIDYGHVAEEVEDALRQAWKTTIQTPQISIHKEIVKPHSNTKFGSLFEDWFRSLISPDAIISKYKKNAGLEVASLNILMSGVIAGIITGALHIITSLITGPKLGTIKTAQFGSFLGSFEAIYGLSSILLIPLGALLIWLGLNTLFYFFSFVLDGTGKFETQLYNTSFFMAALIIIAPLINVFPNACIGFFFYIVLGALGILPLTHILKNVHNFSTGKATLVWILPLALSLIFSAYTLRLFPGMFSGWCLA